MACGFALHALRAGGLLPGETPADSLDTMVRRYVRTLLERLPDGPVHLVGWSMGGTIALAMAGPVPWLIRPAACVSCAACVAVCPVQAIRLEPPRPA